MTPPFVIFKTFFRYLGNEKQAQDQWRKTRNQISKTHPPFNHASIKSVKSYIYLEFADPCTLFCMKISHATESDIHSCLCQKKKKTTKLFIFHDKFVYLFEYQA